MYNGFNDDKHALSFESAMLTAGNSVSHYTEIIKVAQSLMKMTKIQVCTFGSSTLFVNCDRGILFLVCRQNRGKEESQIDTMLTKRCLSPSDCASESLTPGNDRRAQTDIVTLSFKQFREQSHKFGDR